VYAKVTKQDKHNWR